MCFVIQVNTQKPNLAKYYGIKPEKETALKTLINNNSTLLKPNYHVSGFDHPTLYGLTQNMDWALKKWGLIPHWYDNNDNAIDIQNKTLNARIETASEKPSYKTALENGRFVVFVDGYYEHHHVGKSTYPFRFFREDGAQIALAGISDVYTDILGNVRNTFSILTTKGNEKASLVHNNPK